MLIEPVKSKSAAGHVERYVYNGLVVTVPTGTPVAFSEAPYQAEADRFADGLAALRAVA